MDETAAFFRMARAFPLRTCLFSLALPAFALVQLVNGVVNGGALLYIAAFAAIAVAYSVVLTRYQIATFRRRRLVDRLETGEAVPGTD